MTDEIEVVRVYVCPRCSFRSYHPKDAEERYCVRCHRFEDDEPEDAPAKESAR